MGLTTVAAVRTHLGLDNTEDDFLGQVLPAVEAAWAKLTDRNILQATYTEYYSGRNTNTILLREYPVSPGVQVWLDNAAYWGTAPGAFGTGTALTEGVDFALVKDGRGALAECGRLYRIGGVWPCRWESRTGLLASRQTPGAGNVKVTYQAGLAATPSDVQLALWEVVAGVRSRRVEGFPASSGGYEEFSASLVMDATKLFLATQAQIVARYKRLTPRFEVLS